MTDTPPFDDLTPPDELAPVWPPMHYERKDVIAAYRAGARHGWEQARQLWPEPITDRPPTFDDGDEEGYIQVLFKGCYVLRFWGSHQGCPWLNTPRWQPRQPSLQEQALADVDFICEKAVGVDLVTRLTRIRRALEQAGEGQP